MLRESLQHFEECLRFYERYGRELIFKDDSIVRGLGSLGSAIALVNKALEMTGSFNFCAECARKGVVFCGEGQHKSLSAKKSFRYKI